MSSLKESFAMLENKFSLTRRPDPIDLLQITSHSNCPTLEHRVLILRIKTIGRFSHRVKRYLHREKGRRDRWDGSWSGGACTEMKKNENGNFSCQFYIHFTKYKICRTKIDGPTVDAWNRSVISIDLRQQLYLSEEIIGNEFESSHQELSWKLTANSTWVYSCHDKSLVFYYWLLIPDSADIAFPSHNTSAKLLERLCETSSTKISRCSHLLSGL